MEEKAKYTDQAKKTIDAIKKIAESPAALANFESYLSWHFGAWLEEYANTPDGMAEEMAHFSNIE